MPFRILVLSGPNLQLLGTREPEIYGSTTLDEIHEQLREIAKQRNALIDCYQSNHEGDLLDWIGSSQKHFDGILMNAGALTHTSYALHDAIVAVQLPCVEVHLSNPEAREAFRRHSKIASACIGKVVGFGAQSYSIALNALLDWLIRRG